MAALSVLLLDKRLMRSSWLAICFMAASQMNQRRLELQSTFKGA